MKAMRAKNKEQVAGLHAPPSAAAIALSGKIREGAPIARSEQNKEWRAAFRKTIRQPWPKAVKNLLRALCRAYFPTLDAKRAVANLEAQFGGPLAERNKPKPCLAQDARFMGHLAAWGDYDPEKLKVLSESGLTDHELWQMESCNLLKTATDGLPSQKRDEYYREFWFAHSRTFTPLGELRGWTDATPIHGLLLASLLLPGVTGKRPRTIRQLLEWTWHRNPKLKPPVRADGTDPWEQEIKRLQKVCERVGYQLGGQKQKPYKSRMKRTSPDSVGVSCRMTKAAAGVFWRHEESN